MKRKTGSVVTAFLAAFVAGTAWADFTPKSWNGGSSGEWGVDANWSPTGVPTADDAVTIGSGTVTITGASAAAGSLTVASGANLYFGCSGTDILKMTPLAAILSDKLSLTVAGDLSVNGQFAIGGQDHTGTVAVAVGGNLALGANAKMAVYAGEVAYDPENVEAYVGDGGTVTVAGNLTTSSGAWVYPFSHGITGGNVRFTVGGDVTIAATGGFDASGKGFAYPNGPGFYFTSGWSDGAGGGYGGILISGGTPVTTKIYGYAYAPFQSGSPGRGNGSFTNISGGWGLRGGGAIRLHVTGNVSLAGSLLCDGDGKPTQKAGAGSGGSVWITCANFIPAGTAKITAQGGGTNYGHAGCGSGGRVAIMTESPSAEQLTQLYASGTCTGLQVVTTNVNDSTECAYPSLINIAAKKSDQNEWSGPGTGAVLLNISGKSLVKVSILPENDCVEPPTGDPSVGQSVFSGTKTMTACSPLFVPNTNERHRRQCVGYVYTNETGATSSGSGLSCAVTASDAPVHGLVWNYSDLEYRLRAEVVGSGSVSGVAGWTSENVDSWHDAGSTVTLTAVPADGWRFVGWSGETVTKNNAANPAVFEMTDARDIKAVFASAAPQAALAATQDGEWFDVATWGGAGVPDATTAVTIDGKKVTHSHAIDLAAGSITLAGAGSLRLWGTGSAVSAIVPVTSGGDDPLVKARVMGNVSLSGSSWLSVGGQDAAYVSKLTVDGSLSLAGTAKMAVYAGAVAVDAGDPESYVGDGAQVVVSNNLATASGTWIYPYAHAVNGGTVRWTVGGDVTIAAGGGFDASGKGWKFPNGLGVNVYKGDGEGGSHGGWGGSGMNQQGKTRTQGGPYGMRFAPFLPGSPGQDSGGAATGGNGGGNIRIHAGGTFSLAGSLLADGVKSSSTRGAGSGGGVLITCDMFSPATGASISALGPSTSYGYAGGGSGGRVCIVMGAPSAEQLSSLYASGEADGLSIVTTNVNDAAECSYPTLINISGGTASKSVSSGQKGTGAILANTAGKATLNVSIRQGVSAVTMPATTPDVGRSTFKDTITVSAVTPNFVPGTDERQRRQCVQLVYSNSTDQAKVVVPGSSVEVTAADAAEHWVECDYADLEYRLRVSTFGSGSVQGLQEWTDAGGSATLTAVPESGWKFYAWCGDVPGADLRQNPLTLTMSMPRDLKVVFVPVESAPTATAVKSGDWLDAATWGGVAVPDANTDVTVGSSFAVATDFPMSLAAKSLTVTGSGSVSLWGEDNPGLDAELTLNIAGNLSVSNHASMTIGVKDSTFRPVLSVGGDVTFAGDRSVTIYAGAVPTNDLVRFAAGGAKVIAGGDLTLDGWVTVHPWCHTTNGAAVAFRARRIAVGANAKVDAIGKGFAGAYGPTVIPFGTPKKPSNNDYNGLGTSHGGVCALYQSDYPDIASYGFAFAPYWPGCAGGLPRTYKWDGTAGGGVINLFAAKEISVAGKLTADSHASATVQYGAGSGGSVWLTAKKVTIAPTAKITAKTPDENYGYACPSGGGRICVMEAKSAAALELRRAELVATGTSKGVSAVCDNLVDEAKLTAAQKADLVGVFSAAAGQGKYGSYTFVRRATDGTAVWLKAVGAGLAIIVR